MATTTSTTSRIRRPLALAWGLLALGIVAIPLQQSGATFTSRSTNPAAGVTAAPDWTPPVVDLGTTYAIRNGSTITATATDGETGVRTVAFAWAPTSGTITWTPICTATVAPYSCSVNTSGMPADIDIRAVATDGAGYSSTDVLEDVAVDNTAPTVSFGITNNTTLTGVANVPVNATDAQTYVTTVTVQYRLSGTSTWTTVCTDTTFPYGCTFDTTKLNNLAKYELLATAVDLAGNQATTTTTVTVDNRNASVSVVQPDPNYLRGIATVQANAFSNTAITSVAIEWSTGSAANGTWTRICADTTVPYSCDAWDTTKVPHTVVYLRAVLLDAAGTTFSAPVLVNIDNSAFRGIDVQTTNAQTAGRLDNGDTVVLTYNRLLNLSTVHTGWSTGPQAVTLRLRDGAAIGLGGTDDTIDVLVNGSNLSNPTLVALGSVNAKTDLVKPRATVTFTGTMTHSTTTVNGQQASVITLTVGTQATGRTQELRTSTVGATMTWSPSSAARDTTGAAASVAPVSELGALDRDL